MYTPITTRLLASLEAARLRRQARAGGTLWTDWDHEPVMKDGPEARLAALREQSRRGLHYLLNYMLANAEQFLLGLAAKAQSKAEQADIYEAMRELRLKRRGIEKKYTDAVLGGFDDPGPPAPPPPAAPPAQPENPLGIEAPALGLMQEQRLAENLAVDNLASGARLDHRDALLAIGRSLAPQAGQRRVDIDALPIGPLALARHFMHVCHEIEVSPQSRIIFAKIFSRFVIGELGPFYAQCLAALPVEPDGTADRGRAEATEALAPQDLPTGERREEAAETGPVLQPADSTWDSSRTPLLAAPGKAMAMPRSVLDEVLLGLQQQLLDRKKPLANLNPKAGVQPFEVFELINDALAEMGYTRPLAMAVETIETVNLVRMLFEHALRDQKVAQPVRRVVRMLQIPVLRAALRDPDVLNVADHPVRALFREIGNAAIGWTPQGDVAADEFFRKLQSLAGRIITGYGTDAAIFSSCLEDLRAFQRSEHGRVRLLEQRTLTAEVGRSEREAARTAIAGIVGSAVGETALPRVLTDFLRGSWSDALFIVRLQDGVDSSAWAAGVEATAKLVNLVARQELAEFGALREPLSRVLRRLGLDAAGASVQLNALEKALGDSVAAGAFVAPLDTAPAPRERPAASPEYLHLVDKLAPDTWIEFRLPGHAPARARLLTKFPKTGEFLFVNREGAKAGDWKRDDLAAAMQCGEAMILTGPNAPSGTSAPARWGRRP